MQAVILAGGRGTRLGEMTSIGTLFAFVLVAAGILVLRRIDPARPRPFRTPWVPWVPLGAIATCAWLMRELPEKTWKRFFYWLIAGLLIYSFYSFRRSRLNRHPATRADGEVTKLES